MTDDMKKLTPEQMVLIESIRQFMIREYDEDPGYSCFENLEKIDIAYTYASDSEKNEIQVAVNMEDLTLDMYINGVKMDVWQYDSPAHLAFEIDTINFGDLVALGPKSEEYLRQLGEDIP